MLVAAASASASIIGYTPGTAAGGGIIAAPSEVLNASVYNTAQQGFDEKQGVLLAAPLSIDGGSVPAGTVVDSHMIFLNQKNGTGGTLSDAGVVWTFSGTILGVMSDTPGNLEAASNVLLGAPATTYPGAFANRGLEGGDAYSFIGNQLTVKMQVSQPGDWIRVVTAASVPDTGSTALLLVPALGLVALGARRRQA